MSGLIESAGWNSARERREHPRKFLSGTAHVLVPGRAPIEVHTLDISIGGLGIVSPTNLPYEWIGQIRFTLTREPYGVDTVVAPVQVVHSVLSGRQRGFMVGMRFVDLPPDIEGIIQRYMEAVRAPVGASGP
ncbi:PilZ domain-containing protein [Azohydromonas aeria]|uniref:PilZ domain-containing protein n=1 Tax=Azohydromonas aeria TaxID=2590212 RepID=UPI0012F97781|nr:PilZ domain-containing protein [Azohydromonas aeria]